MPIGELEAILHDGSGKQWDPTVVAAYFAVRTELIAMLQSPAKVAPLDLPDWT